MTSSFFAGLGSALNVAMTCRVAIPRAGDEACSHAVCQGLRDNLIEATLIGNTDEIKALYGDLARDRRVTVLAEDDETRACQRAVDLIRDGQADILMKGKVSTSTLLRAVLDGKTGIRKSLMLSHLAFFELEGRPGLKILTDAALNVAPDEEDLVAEVNNAVETFRLLQNREPKVGLLAANEAVSESIPSTRLAAATALRFQGAPFIIEGPISLDLAASPESARTKHYSGAIQGDADIFVVPRIETGNAFYKALQYFTNCPMGGVVVGARCPVVLTSRADSDATKLHSLLLGILLWQRENKGSAPARPCKN